ncbi:hypothetical protein Bbelb_431720, partial [Branchiostoma belcheri]
VAGVASCRDVTRPGSREENGGQDGAQDVITHCYPPERISATAHHVIAPRNQAPTGRVVRIEQFTFRVWTAIWTSSGQFVLRPEPVSNIKPRRTAPLPHDRDPHGFTEKPIQSNRRKNLPGLRKRAINLKEYRADFAFEESIQNMKLCANSGSHQALASTRFLHKTCSQGK